MTLYRKLPRAGDRYPTSRCWAGESGYGEAYKVLNTGERH